MNVRLESVSFRYVSRHAGETAVFDNLSLAIPSGQCVGVLGREGSGKSTLLQMLDGLVTPESGTVLLNGADMTARHGRWGSVRKEIGICFQFPEHQFFGETVRDELLFGMKERGCTEADVMRRGTALLLQAGLDADLILRRSPHSLSMGEARRVALALVLLHRPRLLLVDELSAGLDSLGTHTVLGMLSRALQDGATIIAVSHDTDFLAEIAGRVIVLEAGKIAEDAEAGAVLGDPALLGAYGYMPPQTVAVAGELRRLGVPLPRTLYREEELLEAGSAFRRIEEQSGAT